MDFELSIHGDVQVKRTILRTSEYADDARPAFYRVGGYLRGVQRRQFQSEGKASSGGWPPLAASTIKRKGHNRILWETGQLARSTYAQTSPFHIEKVGRTTFVFGTRDPKAKYHQHGTKHMPRRRVIELTAFQRKRVVRIIQRWIVTGSNDG